MNASLTPNDTTLQKVKLLIDGEWVESQTTEWHDIVNPATQQVLAKVPFATAAEVDAAVSAAQRAFQTWKLTPIGARMRNIMLQFNIEALVVCSVGGVLGVGAGLGVAWLAGEFGRPVIFSMPPVMMAFASAVLTGLLFGFLPARRAAAMDPVVALSAE